MFRNKETFKKEFEKRIVEKYGRGVKDSHITEKYDVLGTMVRDYPSFKFFFKFFFISKHKTTP